MARTPKTTTAPRRDDRTLCVRVDPLAVPRGVQRLPAGVIHRSARHPGRAAQRRALRREFTAV